MEAYSVDLRKRVLADCDAGLGTKEVAAKFQVSESWVRRLKQRRRETGAVAPLPRSGGRPIKIAGAREKRLKALLRKHPDATLHELRRRLRLKCCVSTVHLAVIRLGMSYKKSHSMPANSSAPT
jgi:transposase